MKLTELTSIGRTIDPEYPTNRAIAVLTIAVTVGGALWQLLSGTRLGESVVWGIEAGLTILLAWALCRELDPDHPMAAFVAVGLALPALYLWGLPQLGAIFWLVVLVRVVNRSVGLPAGVLDALGLVGLGGWLSLQGHWGYGAVTALALFLDSQLPERAQRQLVFALLAVIVTVGVAILGNGPTFEGAPSITGGLMGLALFLVFVPVVFEAREVESVGDYGGEPLTPVRVQAAQALALLSGVGVGFLGGVSGVVGLSPLWSATLGAAIGWVYRLVVG